jgi:hypothetical protein
MKTLLLTLLFIFLFGMTHANPVDSVKTTNNTCDSILAYMRHAMLFNEVMPQEKVYLHFDNTGYFKGETIWFKAYVVRADKGTPTDISRVLHVELVTPNGEVVQKRKLKVDDNGQADGSLTLDSIYTTGFYEVRAYTRYMTNWGHTGIFSRVFPVFKKPKTEGDYSAPVIDRFSYNKRLPNYRGVTTARVVFYPEGGSLVRGLRSRVAFTVVDEDGRPVSTLCRVTDEEGGVADSVVTDSMGRGVVEVLPGSGRLSLAVRVKDGKRKDKWEEEPLPDAKESGCAIRLETVSDNVTADIRTSEDMQGRMLGYVLMNGGNIIECDTFTVTGDMRMAFGREDLPPGVNQLTVFGSDGRIQAERLFFISPRADVADSIRIRPITEKLTPCGKVAMSVRTMPNTTFSFSAMDNATMVNGTNGGIRSWMLLSSDLKGYIANPEYYFEADDEEHRRAADLLMMVQGWRRYDWNVMTDRTKLTDKVESIEDKLYVFGKLKPKRKRHRVDNVALEVYLFNRNGESLKGEAVTDSAGNYAFELPDISGEWNMQIVTRNEGKRKNYFITIDRHFTPKLKEACVRESERIPEPEANITFERDMDADERDALKLLQKRERVLPTVKVKAKKRFTDGARAAWESETQAQFWSNQYYDCDAEMDKIADMGEDAPDFFEWLAVKNPFFFTGSDWSKKGNPNYENMTFAEKKEYLQKINVWNGRCLERIYYDPENIYKRIPPPKYMYYKNWSIKWVLNNVTFRPEQDGEGMPLDLDEVKSVYVSENPEAFVNYQTSVEDSWDTPIQTFHLGATVFIYTHHSFLFNQKGLRRTHFQGYNEPQTFQMEDYSILPPMEDFRRTIYWNPNVKTDSEGKATVEFYNNSSCTEMFISSEGMTKDGRFVVY